MIEVVYKDESRESKENSGGFRIPRNIRQIGLSGGKYRIYVEDYVYTFMKRLAEKAQGENGGLAILTGRAEWNEGTTYVFVKGAIYLEEQVNAEHISLESETWKKVQEIGEKYFSELDVVGWFLTIPQIPLEITDIIGKTHLKYFSGGEKILMMMDPLEKDEAFFYYENGRFMKAPGYYLYYEKNLKMQEYITDHKWWETSENEKVIPDEAVKSFRKRIARKAEKSGKDGKGIKTGNSGEQEEKPSIFSYAATACLVIAIMATGANFIRNYQQIQTVEEELEASAVFTVDDQVEISVTPGTGRKGETSEKVNIEEAGTKETNTSGAITNEVDTNGTDSNGEEGAAVSTEEVESRKTVKEEESTPEENVRDNLKEENSPVGTNELAEEGDSVDGSESVNGTAAGENKQEVSGDSAAELENNENQETETSGKSVFNTYMVRPGDTLYQISILNYGNMDAITEICRLNNISEEETIYPGQIIVLP